VPGPAKYNLININEFGSNSPKYTINPLHIHEQKIYTGLGLGDLNDLNYMGNPNSLKMEIENIYKKRKETISGTGAGHGPGPGHYESIYNSEGKYALSSLKNTIWSLWGNSKSQRFKRQSKVINYVFI